MVEDVVDLPAKLKRTLLTKRNVFEEREIRSGDRGAHTTRDAGFDQIQFLIRVIRV